MIQDISTALSQIIVNIGDYFSLWVSEHLVNVIAIVLVAIAARRILTALTVNMLKKTLRPDMYPTENDRKKRLTTLDSLMTAIVRVAVWTIAGITIASEMGINTAPLIASAGIVGIALGFGAQSLVKDFTTGMFLIMENQFRVGDSVDIGGATGTVEHVGMRTTVLRDLNGYVHHVPNGLIEVSTNKTVGFGRINEEIVVGAEADIDRVEHIINHVGEEMLALPEYKKIIIEPPSFASVKGYAANGLRVGIRGKTKAGEQWGVRTDMYKRLKKAFDKAGIEITNMPPVAPAPAKKK